MNTLCAKRMQALITLTFLQCKNMLYTPTNEGLRIANALPDAVLYIVKRHNDINYLLKRSVYLQTTKSL